MFVHRCLNNLLFLSQLASLTLRAQRDLEAHEQRSAAAAALYAADAASVRATLTQTLTQQHAAALAAQQAAHTDALASLRATHAVDADAAEAKLAALTATYEAQIATWRSSAQVRGRCCIAPLHVTLCWRG